MSQKAVDLFAEARKHLADAMRTSQKSRGTSQTLGITPQTR
jgi:hypothetical protein